MKNVSKFALGIAAIATVAVALQPETPVSFTGNGDPQALSSLYDRWKTNYESHGNTEVLRLSLQHSKAQSKEMTAARGSANVNLLSGELNVAIAGLPDQGKYEVWLLDNHHKHASPEQQLVKVGELTASGEKRQLKTTLDRQTLQGFTLDSVAVAEAGSKPAKGGVLFGSPSLMQRIYFSERFWPVAGVGSANPDPQTAIAIASPFEFMLPKVANASEKARKPADQLNELVARGRKIFTEETFEGNGRTCATCHRPDNNHTIDPAYIAKLPKDDALFIAEHNPQLADLEKPALLRQFGLFVANVDGFDRPPVLRSAPYLLGMAKTLGFETIAQKGEFIEDDNYFYAHDAIAQQDGRTTQAIGWSGDGAPDGGSLRDFAKGAITQHMPKTLNRVAGSDFRMPDEDELDALEAYMLSLGRSEEVNLAAMQFKSPMVQKGKLLFDTKNNPGQTLDAAGYPNGGAPSYGTTANCNGCHSNAGAISSTTGGNPTRDTGVERMRDQLHRLVDPSVAYDGGFGQELQADCGPSFTQTCYSDGSKDPRGIRPADHQRLNRFNTPSLIEAADTGPFFHNNSITTLEETVAYYNTEAFNNSPGAFTSKGINRQVKMDSSQVIAVALFLRSINVLENIRSSSLMDQKAMELRGDAAEQTIYLALVDTEDAVQVLSEAVINPYPEATDKLKSALALEHRAMDGYDFGGKRQRLLQKAIDLKAEAKAMIADGV
jgi:mono/diheme cytochrome c family protein